MEALAAVSLAGNILQFVHTARSLISTSREIFDAGSKKEYLELEVVARELRTRIDRLNAAGRVSANGGDDSIESLALRSKAIADELLGVLDRLKLKEDNDKWKSILQALKSQWHDREIESLRKRLSDIAQAVNARLADNNDLSIKSRLDKLLDDNRRLEISRTVDIVELRKHFDDALKENRNQMNERKLAERISKVASDSWNFSAEQVILSQLRFIRLEDRYSSISEAHRKTLSWMFDATSPNERKAGSATFVDWLSSEDDLYWISGRPGSGKSTLMKFLCTHEQTKTHLKSWAQSDNVIVAEYFFWNAGKNELQKSQEGLLRSLLYQVLRQCPDYIRQVFPDAWRLYNPTENSATRSSNVDLDNEIPEDIQGLMNALKRMCTLLTESEKRLCFFIDGLDEYEGDTIDLIQLVDVLRTLKHVKLCVSSRQWNEFEDAYGKVGTAKLYMQDFNDQDINAYINDVFANDDNYQELEDKETRGKALIEEIVTAAHGVFLWVVLVVRSFQEGLREGDSISRLQGRLRQLPTKLEDYFERILFHDVKDSYRDQAAQMFLVTLVALENLPLMAYWFLDEPDLPKEREPLKVQQTTKRHKIAKKRLIASCKGLLEPQFHVSTHEQDALPSAVLFEYKVDFLHRTVRDYLELPTTNIEGWAAAGFDPHEAICKAVYCQVKTAPHGQEYRSHILALCQVFEHHARISIKSRKEGNAGISKLRDEIWAMQSLYDDFETPILSNTWGTYSGKGDADGSEKSAPVDVNLLTVQPSNSQDRPSSSPASSTKRPSAVKRWLLKVGGGK